MTFSSTLFTPLYKILSLIYGSAGWVCVADPLVGVSVGAVGVVGCGVSIGVRVWVRSGIAVGDSVGVTVLVGVTVGDSVGVSVLVGVGDGVVVTVGEAVSSAAKV